MISKINSEIFSFFPNNIRQAFISAPTEIIEKACEIRFRVNKPIIIICEQSDYILKKQISNEDILRLLENFSNNSVYSIQNELNCGFITLKGGHRIGVSGTTIFENGMIKNIKYISSFNIRIAREVKDCSLKILTKITKNDFNNTLIISPPRVW